MKPPLFTIATISYNSSKWIHECINSILNSSFTDFELIISDDCSTDDSWQIVQQFSDPRITAWKNEKNLGEYKNRNKVLQSATGEYFLFVDGDDILYPKSLEILMEYISDFPQLQSIYGISKACLPEVLLPKLLNPKEAYQWIYSFNIPIAFVGFAETLFKTEFIKKIGGFPEGLECGDTYIKKLIPAYGPILIVEAGLQYWRISTNQASAKLGNNLTGYQNNVRIDRMILSNPEVIPNLPNLDLCKRNTMVRNIKLLFRHTFLKFKFIEGLNLFKKLEFKISDLQYLFKKAKLERIN